MAEPRFKIGGVVPCGRKILLSIVALTVRTTKLPALSGSQSGPPLQRRCARTCVVTLALILMTIPSPAADALHHRDWEVALQPDASVSVRRGGLSPMNFAPRFLVLTATNDPRPEFRWADLGEVRMREKYNVLTWRKGGGVTPSPKTQTKTNQHVADGFDLRTDQTANPGETMNAFAAGPSISLTATSGSVSGNKIVWAFPDSVAGKLTAELELSTSNAAPSLRWSFTPKSGGWFSVAYVGAPEVELAAADEIWQPLIWQEKRFPNQPFLTESARCTLPTAMVSQRGVTWGVLAAPEELPFQPLPTPANSRFGIAVRNAAGRAQPTLFAPILGGVGSKRRAGEAISFRCLLMVNQGGTTAAFEQIAREQFQFRDYRRNDALGSLNRTLERMTDYAMSQWARFDGELRGSAYETDVPGSVKNVSALHPLGVALVTDDERLFTQRAKPMIEYVLSREKFLFTTDPKVTGQGASANLTGPCAPVSELAALYEMSGRRSPHLLAAAEKLFGQARTLNLDDEVPGGSWQNALALYRATGEAKWIARAKAGADAYLRERLATPQPDFHDRAARGMFFWTSYAPNWMELYELYEASGEPRYLAAARDGARRFSQFIWMCPPIPAGDLTVNPDGLAPAYRRGANFPRIKIAEETVPAWRLSEIGLTCESSGTSKGHRGILLATHAPWMLRLAAATGDAFLHDIARSAVVGRYTSFPGYHLNTARTTVYEKPDFAERSTAEINSTSSLHYNHIWPQIALLVDYLVSDAFARSGGRIDFPAHFAEGYAYLQLKIYGDRPGNFLGDTNAWLWMPKGLLTCDNAEVNYLAARSGNTLYLALMNQSANAITAGCQLDPGLVGLNPDSAARVWNGKEEWAATSFGGGKFAVNLAANGMTVVAVTNVVITPGFQNTLRTASPVWSVDQAGLKGVNAQASLLNFGGDRRWAYIFLQERDEFKNVTLSYHTGGDWQMETDAKFPFEFSVVVPAEAKEFAFKIRAERASGGSFESEIGRMK